MVIYKTVTIDHVRYLSKAPLTLILTLLLILSLFTTLSPFAKLE